MKSKIVWKTTTFCYTFKLTSTFIQTLKVTTERTSALPLKLGEIRKKAPLQRPRRPHLKFTLATLYSTENKKEVTHLKKYQKNHVTSV
jgi:hypothetical protein